MEDFKNSNRLHTTSRILTSDEYISELFERNLKKMKILNNRRISCLELYNYRELPQVASFDYEIINSVEGQKMSDLLITLEKSLDEQAQPILEPSFPVLEFSMAANIDKVQSNRILDFINSRKKAFVELTYDERIRNFITIFNRILNKSSSIKTLEYFEEQVANMKQNLDKQFDDILKKLSEVASVDINNDIQAMFILGLIKSNKLDEYKDTHPNGLPLDPIQEFLEKDQTELLGRLIDEIRTDLNALLAENDDPEIEHTLDEDIEGFRSQLSQNQG